MDTPSNDQPTAREQALCMLALALVSLSNNLPPTEAVHGRLRKQFVDHLISHGVPNARANHLHKLLQADLQPTGSSED